jgi:hypothetical protein
MLQAGELAGLAQRAAAKACGCWVMRLSDLDRAT